MSPGLENRYQDDKAQESRHQASHQNDQQVGHRRMPGQNCGGITSDPEERGPRKVHDAHEPKLNVQAQTGEHMYQDRTQEKKHKRVIVEVEGYRNDCDHHSYGKSALVVPGALSDGIQDSPILERR